MDFFIDRLYKQVILEHIKGFSWDDDKIKAREVAMWEENTRLMFRHYPAVQVYDMVDEACARMSDESYNEKRIHEIMQKSISISEGIKRNPKVKGVVRREIDKRIKITDIAKKFGLDPDPKGKILCPFHADSDPSCSLNDDKNIFHCFGCGAKGDVIEFYRRLKDD